MCRPSPSNPEAPATTPSPSPKASVNENDVSLTLVARRNDGERWHQLTDHRANIVTAVPGSRPARLAFEQVGFPRVARETRRRRPPRAALHHARAIAGALCGHHPRLHLLRSSRMAPAFKGGLLSTGHYPGRHPSRCAHLREPGHGRPAAGELRRAGSRHRGAARRRSSTLLARRTRARA